MSIWSNVFGRRGGSSDPERGTLWTTPWRWRTDDCMYFGHNKEVWLYRRLSVAPIRWEDPDKRMAVESPLANLLYELGDTSVDVGAGIKQLAKLREFHLLAATWEEEATAPPGTPAPLTDFLEDDILVFRAPVKALFIGVKLWPSLMASSSGSKNNMFSQVRSRATTLIGSDVPDPKLYESDRKRIVEILTRNGAGRVPSKPERAQLESWFNLGRGPDVAIMETKDLLYVDSFDRIEIAALREFERPMMNAPEAQWALDAATHESPASVMSVRGRIEPTAVSRGRIRQSQRRVLDQIEQEAATEDIERPEQAMTLNLAQEVERFILTGREPLITDCSILMARRVGSDVPETYIDELRNVHGIEMAPLDHRQIQALDEMLPCSSMRINPFLQDVSVAMLAYAGFQAFSSLGDKTGVFVGLSDPDYAPCWLDPLGAPAADKPPGLLIAGRPGSGKTFLCQTIAVQAALAGKQCIFVNPKGFSSLAGMFNLVPGHRIGLSDISEVGGFFDPFRYSPPEIAAEIAINHILTVLGSRGTQGQGFDQNQEIALSAGIREGASKGAQCVYDALQYVKDPSVIDSVRNQASDPLFRIGIGLRPQPPLRSDTGLLLIEFDRNLDLPESGVKPSEYTRSQRLALAAIRLATRASMEILASNKGGVVVVDEAWTFLQSSEGLAAIQSMGRLGRSQNILPIFATQRVDDLLQQGVDMEDYLSRVFVMELNEEKEQRAALKLCGLEATAQRLEWLSDAGPRQASEDGRPGRPAFAIHRDLKGSHGAVLIGPFPDEYRRALSTTPEGFKSGPAPASGS